MSELRQKVTDKSGDRKYFTMVPRVVSLLCESPQERSLWTTIKEIAGEDGECYLATEDLGLLADMAAGTVVRYRKSLMEKGLIGGKIIKDPGYPQPVYHLWIPDLWDRNLRVAEQYKSIASRLELKRAQRAAKKLARGKRSSSEGSAERSSNERGPLTGERGPLTGEQGPLTDETKKNQQRTNKEQKEYNRDDLLDSLALVMGPATFDSVIRPLSFEISQNGDSYHILTVTGPESSIEWAERRLARILVDTLDYDFGLDVGGVIYVEGPEYVQS